MARGRYGIQVKPIFITGRINRLTPISKTSSPHLDIQNTPKAADVVSGLRART